MAQIVINIPDAVAPRVVDALCKHYRYDEIAGRVEDMPTKPQFAKNMVVRHIKSIVLRVEAEEAAEVARKQAIEAGDQEIVLS